MQNQYKPPRSAVADVNRSGGSITTDMMEAMRGTKPWTMLIGVVLIILSVFMFLGTIGMVIASLGAAALGNNPAMSGFPIFLVAIFYGIGAIVYLVLGIYLIKYSRAIGRLVLTNSISDMEEALWSQRKFWKLSGILTLIGIIFAILAIIAAIALPMLFLGGMGMH